MPGLEWLVTEEGHECAGYRIRRISERPPRWQLETVDDPVLSGARSPTVSVHPSLPAAKRRAERDERERIRRGRVRGHIVFGVITGLMCLVLLITDSLAAFVAAMILLYAAIRFLAGAMELGLAEAWNWDEGPEARGRLSWSARIVLAVTEYLRKRQLTDDEASQSPAAIIVLPPDRTA